MRTKAKDRIELSTGRVMTLAEALDAGLVELQMQQEFSRTREDSRGRALETIRYVAREVGGDRLGWEVGETLYKARKGRPLSFRANDAGVPAWSLTAPEPLPMQEERSIAGRTILGIVANPKTREPVLVTTDLEYVSIRSLRAAELLKKLGTGYYESSPNTPLEVTGFPRVHTPQGVSTRGMGYGTSLYTGLLVGAHLKWNSEIQGLDMRGKGDGISSTTDDRSSEADRWWASAHRFGLTTIEESEGETEIEEDIDLRVSASDIESCVSVEGDLVRVNALNVDIEKTTEGITVDAYPFEKADEHSLVVCAFEELRVPGLLDADQAMAWLFRTVFDEPDHIVHWDAAAVLALDVRDLEPGAVNLVSLAGIKAELGDDELDGIRYRHEHGLDPDQEGPRQERLFRNDPLFGPVVRARAQARWDELAELP